MNATLGIGGVLDPASAANLPYSNEDFGQTLGKWGWRRSRYVELPLFGPRTMRDVFGLIGDAPLSPLRQVEDDPPRRSEEHTSELQPLMRLSFAGLCLTKK